MVIGSVSSTWFFECGEHGAEAKVRRGEAREKRGELKYEASEGQGQSKIHVRWGGDLGI